MSTLTWEEQLKQVREDQTPNDKFKTIVGRKVIGAEQHGGHGAEYTILFDDGSSLYITMSDHTKDLVCRLRP